MRIITAIKDNKAIYGSPDKIGEIVGLTGEAIRKRIRENTIVMARNGYIIYLKTERIR